MEKENKICGLCWIRNLQTWTICIKAIDETVIMDEISHERGFKERV